MSRKFGPEGSEHGGSIEIPAPTRSIALFWCKSDLKACRKAHFEITANGARSPIVHLTAPLKNCNERYAPPAIFPINELGRIIARQYRETVRQVYEPEFQHLRLIQLGSQLACQRLKVTGKWLLQQLP